MMKNTLLGLGLIMTGVVLFWIVYPKNDQLAVINLDGEPVCIAVSGIAEEMTIPAGSAARRSINVPMEGVVEWRYCGQDRPAVQLAYVTNYQSRDHFVVVQNGAGSLLFRRQRATKLKTENRGHARISATLLKTVNRKPGTHRHFSIR